MGKRLNILLILLGCSIIYAFYYLGLPYIINLERFNPIITNYIKKEYGFSVELLKPNLKMAYSPSIWVKADKFTIFNNDNTVAMSADKPVIKISIIPLLIGRVNLKYFSAEKLYTDFYCDDKLRISLGQYLILKTSDLRFSVSNSKILIDRFNIRLNDKIKNEIILVDGKYLKLDKFIKNRYLKGAVNFDVTCGKEKSSVDISVDTKLPFKPHLNDYPPEFSFSVANFNFAKFNNYIKYLSDDYISDIKGIVNMEIHSDNAIFGQKHYLSNVLIDNFAIKTKLFEKDYIYPYKIHIKSNYLLKDDELTIPAFSFNTDNFSAKLSGKVDKISSRNAVPSLEFKLFDAKAKDIIELLPYCEKLNKSSKINISVIKDANFNAIVNAKLKISDNLIKPNVIGSIDITDAYIDRPITNTTKNAEIHIKCIGDKFNLNVHVPTDTNQFVSVKGIIDSYDDNYADLHITSTELINLSEAERVLMPVHKAFDFLLGPVPIMNFSGYGSIDLKIKGTKKEPHAYGWLKTLNASVFFDEIPNFVLSNIDAILNFDDFDTKFTLNKGKINGQEISLNGNCNLDGTFEYFAKMPMQNAKYILNALKTSTMLNEKANTTKGIDDVNGNCDIELDIYGHIKDIADLKIGDNVHAKGKILLHSVNAKLSNIRPYFQHINGEIKFDDFLVKLKLSSNLGASKLNLSGSIDNDNAKLDFILNKTLLADILSKLDLPISVLQNAQKDLSTIDIKGRYDGNFSTINLHNLNINGNINFRNSNLIYKPYNMPINVAHGNIVFRNNNINIGKLNGNIGSMPAVIAGKVDKVFDIPQFDLAIFAKPNQKFLDYIFNARSIYPMKIKGNSIFTLSLLGNRNKFNFKSNLKLSENSSFYYMGATLGGDKQPVNLFIDSLIEPNRIFIKNLNYNKSNIQQLSSSGFIYNDKNTTSLGNFKINTYVPTDMKMFNIIFKKPFIKNGKFTANLLINGKITEPDMRGDLSLFDMDIPFIDSSIKNISMRFLQNSIIAEFNGSILDNLFTLQVDAKNSLKPPYIINNAKINSGKLNINNIYDAINNYELNISSEERNENKTNKLNLNQFIIKRLNIIADNIYVNDINAKDLEADLSLNNGNFKIDNFKFKMAKGVMDGSVGYNIHSNKSNFDLKVEGADADTLMSSLFDLGGQIFGDLDGQLNFSCDGETREHCLKTLDGHAVFRVKDGRMPKLGSLEYLLKAGNLMKSGITGFSINGIMELIVPLKTGSFENIKGSVDINKGVADKIQISTEGKDLNLFIIGEYNLASKYADMYVFGRISRKISTILGPIGNVSLNTLFNTIPGVNLNKSSDTGLINNINKIPGLELSSKIYRVFAAEIHGDISGDDYVDSFRWIE